MSSNRNVYGYVHMNGKHIVTSLFDDTGFPLQPIAYPWDTNNAAQVQQFLVNLSTKTDLTKIKLMVFTTSDFMFSSFAAAYNFRLQCLNFCKRHGIDYCLDSQRSDSVTATLAKTKTMVKEGEKIMIIRSSGPQQYVCGATHVREKDGYRLTTITTPQQPTQEWKKKLLENARIQKFFITREMFDTPEYIAKMKELFKDEHLVIYNEDLSVDLELDGMTRHISYKIKGKVDPYHISPHCMNNLTIRFGNDVLIATPLINSLPFEQSSVILVDANKAITLRSDTFSEIIKEVKLSTFKCKKVKVTLKIDVNAFYDFKVEPVDGEEMAASTSEMNIAGSTAIDKARLIFGEQNFTVWLTTKGKQFVVENEDDCDTTPIYIAFTTKKPLIGKAVKEIYQKKPQYVVFDLIKLCSITNADVMSPKWGFKLEKEENGALMVAMDTVDGERRSSVEFLLALILKHGLQIIKNENGKRMEEIEIGFDGFTANEMLKKNFEKAAALINLKIVFV